MCIEKEKMKKYFRIKKTLVLLLTINMVSSLYFPVYATENIETYVENDYDTIAEIEEEVLPENELPKENPEDDQEIFDGYEEFFDGYQELLEEPPFPVVNPISDNQMHTASVEEEEIPSSYNSTEDFHIALPEYMPDLRNQTPYGSCWSFTSLSLGEIYMKKYGIAWLDLSELHLAYFSYNYQPDPLGGTLLDKNWATYDSSAPNFLQRGGNLSLSQNILASWLGAAEESLVPYNTASTVINEGINPDYAYKDVAHLTHYYNVNVKNDPQSVKKLIMQNGAIGCSYFHDTSKYNRTHNSYYTKTSPNQINHAITIVGWNDNFPAEYFNEAPDGDGAWLIRNSWWNSGSALENLNGYFWLSYYDKSMHSNGFSFTFDTAEKYDNNYQYDGASISGAFTLGTKNITGANVFCAKANEAGETLEAVSFATADANVDYKIDIYVNPIDETKPDSGTHIANATTEGTITYAGYYTIPLAQKVTLENGDIFSVVVKLSSTSGSTMHLAMEISSDQGWVSTTATTQPGQSFYLKAGNWIDNSSKENYGNFRIKAFTKNVQDPTFVSLSDFSFSEDTQKMHLLPGEEQIAEVSYEPADATRKTLIWESEDERIAEVTEAGTVIAHSSGTVNISASYRRNGEIAIRKTFPLKVSLLKWTDDEKELFVGEGKTLEYETDMEECPIWISSNEQILTVDEKGTVFGHTAGNVVVTLSIAGKSISKNIRVSESFSVVLDNIDWTYTGTAIKPKVTVVDELLGKQLGKNQYQVFYANNRFANYDTVSDITKCRYITKETVVLKQKNIDAFLAAHDAEWGAFDPKLPYIVVQGKNGYAGTMFLNFNINPISLFKGDKTPAENVTVSINDTIEVGKSAAILTVVKINGKALKFGTDYVFSIKNDSILEAQEYTSGSTKYIPKTANSYTLQITGKGGYTGVGEFTFYADAKSKLLSNTKIAIGENVKKVDYHTGNFLYKKNGTKWEFADASSLFAKDAEEAKNKKADMISVVLEGKYLTTADFDVSYRSNEAVGTATVLLKAKATSAYVGIKSFTFQITGTPLKASDLKINGEDKLPNRVYDSKAQTLEYIFGTMPTLTYQGKTLDSSAVSVSYSNHINKGTATVTFTGKPEMGYTGSVKKTFNITACPLQKSMTDSETAYKGKTATFTKMGSAIDSKICLRMDNGYILKLGTDYTLKYNNHKDGKKLVEGGKVIIQGIGNFSGTLGEYSFGIKNQNLATGFNTGIIGVSVSPIAYKAGKADKTYKPQISVYDGTSKLKIGTDIEVTAYHYDNGSIAKYLDDPIGYAGFRPYVEITGLGKGYEGTLHFYVPIKEVSQHVAFTESDTKLSLKLDPITYSGTVRYPLVTVKYNDTVLVKGKDYALVYGRTITGKGSVTICGLGKYYGSIKKTFQVDGRYLK